MIGDKVRELFADAAAGDMASIVAIGCFGGIAVIVSMSLIVQMLQREGSGAKKIFWAMVLLVPLIGWMFYLAFYKVPPSQVHR
ncbi:PLDc N-terminal domain-containing protein [Rubritalea tangerina]|uniref:PLDc N-terminal domain-containing protein n=1 Tax=Rubritalea tangerina TaxID=430798 RepID=A0ABW4ZE76_9BACT